MSPRVSSLIFTYIALKLRRLMRVCPCMRSVHSLQDGAGEHDRVPGSHRHLALPGHRRPRAAHPLDDQGQGAGQQQEQKVKRCVRVVFFVCPAHGLAVVVYDYSCDESLW